MKVPARPVLACSIRTRADDLEDRDGWPIRETARVACRRKGKLWSGKVLGTYRDQKGRPQVDVSTPSGIRLFRPEEVRVQPG
jgi:hypothetical protein